MKKPMIFIAAIILAFAACQKSDIAPVVAPTSSVDTRSVETERVSPNVLGTHFKTVQFARIPWGIDFGDFAGSHCWHFGICKMEPVFNVQPGVFYNTGYAASAVDAEKRLCLAFDARGIDAKTIDEQFGTGQFVMPKDKVIPVSDLRKAGFTVLESDYRIAAGKYPVIVADSFLLVRF